jgi:5'-phosphate synthase pdxT subunit
VSANIGVLSVQGAFDAHRQALRRLGATTVAVRTPDDLDGLAGLVLPGGESTAMSLLMRSNGLWSALAALLRDGVPVLATCAGVILVASELRDGRPDQGSLCAVDVSVRRNAFGRQSDSFEADLTLTTGDPPFPGVFIRAPVIERIGAEVEVLATFDGPGGPTPVLCRQRNVVMSTFHPELTDDPRVHRLAFARVVDAAESDPRVSAGSR